MFDFSKRLPRQRQATWRTINAHWLANQMDNAQANWLIASAQLKSLDFASSVVQKLTVGNFEFVMHQFAGTRFVMTFRLKKIALTLLDVSEYDYSYGQGYYKFPYCLKIRLNTESCEMLEENRCLQEFGCQMTLDGCNRIDLICKVDKDC